MASVKRKLIFGTILVFTFLCSCINGIDMAFSVYAILLKDTFNFTQVQVEITASTGTMGFGMSFIEAIIARTIGYPLMFILFVVLLPITSACLSVEAHFSDVFYNKPFAIYATHFAMSLVNSMCMVSHTGVVLQIIPRKHTGKFMGFISGAMCLGKSVYAGLVNVFFPTDLSGLFMVISVSSFLFFGVYLSLLHYVLKSPDFGTETQSAYKNIDNEPELVTEEKMGIKHMFSSPGFHSIFWPAVMFYACAFTCLNNLTSIAASVGVENPMAAVYVISASIFCSRIISGITFDRLASESWGLFQLIICYCVFTTGVLLGLFCFNTPWTVFLAAVLFGLGLGPSISIPVTVLAMRFGSHNYTTIVSSFFALTATLQFLFQIALGVLYEKEIKLEGLSGNACFGKDCYHWSFVGMFVITLVAIFAITTTLVLTTFYKNQR